MRFSLKSFGARETRSGVYIGGIGAGGFEPRPDGRYYRCQMFNQWRAERELDLMFVHYRQGDDQARVLRFDDYVSGWGVLKGVDRIDYCGEFPRVSLAFPGRDVSLQFQSVFIPGDLKHSSLPLVSLRVIGRGPLLMCLKAPFLGSYEVKETDREIHLTGAQGSLIVSARKAQVCVSHLLSWIVNGMHKKDWEARATLQGTTIDGSYLMLSWRAAIDDVALLTWYAPENRDFEGNLMGHAYTNYFDSCAAVHDYVKENLRDLMAKTAKFHRSIFSSKRPDFLKDAYSAQLSTFVKQSWLAKDGRFGVWEGGCCCCGLQTTDVSYYGSWLYVNLFPELEKSGMRLTAKFQREDGWIPHFFPGTFEKIDEYRRKDMNMQFVLMAYRDVALWRDDAFLKEIYPHVKAAIEAAYAWDINGDLIPEVEPRAQTFDTWEFTGSSMYLASLWLAALRMGARMAQEIGDAESARRWSSDAAIVRDAIDTIFWNGDYYILAVDSSGRRDACCLIDALSGDWYCRLLGMGGILDDAKVISHLKACIKHNRKRIDPSYMKSYYTEGEKGWCIINGGYPDNRRIGSQQYEPWTGLEYAFGLHCLLMGLEKEGMRAIKDVADRKAACGMSWNHIECGGEYFRPMVIGAVWERKVIARKIAGRRR